MPLHNQHNQGERLIKASVTRKSDVDFLYSEELKEVLFQLSPWNRTIVLVYAIFRWTMQKLGVSK